MNISAILSVSLILFSVIDIIGSLPILINMKKEGVRINASIATGFAAIIMIAFLFIGEEILNLIGIDINSFAVAGSIVIFFLALEMILGIQLYKEESPETASIVPIAFPLIAGAGTLTSLLALRAEFDVVNIIVAIVANLVVVYVVLKSSHRIEKILGNSGISVIRKVFGIILLAIAVKLFASNVQELF